MVEKPEKEDRGCGSFNVFEDEEGKQCFEEMLKAMTAVNDEKKKEREVFSEVLSENSLLLDGYESQNFEQKNLPLVRESEEYSNHKNSPFLKKMKTQEVPKQNMFEKKEEPLPKDTFEMSQDTSRIFKKDFDSTSVSSYNESSTSSAPAFKKPKNKKRGRQPMAFVKPTKSPVRTRSQTNKLQFKSQIS